MDDYQERLQQIVDRALIQLKAISFDKMSLKPSPDKWSRKEILGHLIDSAYNNHWRFLVAAQKGNLYFEGYNQTEWVTKNNYQNRQVSEIINIWSVVNQHLCTLLGELPRELLLKETNQHNFHTMCFNLIPEGASSSLSYLIWDYIAHLEHHLAQIIDGYVPLNPAFQSGN